MRQSDGTVDRWRCEHALAIRHLLLAGLLAVVPELFGQSTVPTTRRAGEVEVRMHEGLLHYQLRDLAAAESDFRAVLEEHPHDVESRYYLALALSGQGREERAVAELDRVLAAAPDFMPARLSRAAALIRLGRYALAEADIVELERDADFRSAALSLRGQLLYAQGRYREAASTFERARAAGAADDAPEAALLHGLSLYRAGDVKRSQAALRRAAGIDLDPSLTLATQQLEAALQAQRGPRLLEAELGVGYEYDSNVALADEDLVLPEALPRRDDGRFVLEPRARFTPLRTDRLQAGLSTTNYFSFQNRLSEFDITSYQVGAFANYQVSRNVVAGLRYDFNSVDLGHDPFLKRNIVTPEITYFEGGFGYTGIYYQFDARQFTPIGGEGRLNRDGDVRGVGAVQSIDLPELIAGAGAAELQLIGRLRHQQTRGEDYVGTLSDIGATLFVPLSRRLRADLGANFGLEDYRNPNSLDYLGRQRRDVEYTLTAGLTRQINRSTLIRAEYVYTNHDSNVLTPDSDSGGPLTGESPYEFEHHVVGVKMIFRF